MLKQLHADAKSHVLYFVLGVSGFSFGIQKQEVPVFEVILSTSICSGKVD